MKPLLYILFIIGLLPLSARGGGGLREGSLSTVNNPMDVQKLLERVAGSVPVVDQFNSKVYACYIQFFKDAMDDGRLQLPMGPKDSVNSPISLGTYDPVSNNEAVVPKLPIFYENLRALTDVNSQLCQDYRSSDSYCQEKAEAPGYDGLGRLFRLNKFGEERSGHSKKVALLEKHVCSVAVSLLGPFRLPRKGEWDTLDYKLQNYKRNMKHLDDLSRSGSRVTRNMIGLLRNGLQTVWISENQEAIREGVKSAERLEMVVLMASVFTGSVVKAPQAVSHVKAFYKKMLSTKTSKKGISLAIPADVQEFSSETTNFLWAHEISPSPQSLIRFKFIDRPYKEILEESKRTVNDSTHNAENAGVIASILPIALSVNLPAKVAYYAVLFGYRFTVNEAVSAYTEAMFINARRKLRKLSGRKTRGSNPNRSRGAGKVYKKSKTGSPRSTSKKVDKKYIDALGKTYGRLDQMDHISRRDYQKGLVPMYFNISEQIEAFSTNDIEVFKGYFEKKFKGTKAQLEASRLGFMQPWICGNTHYFALPTRNLRNEKGDLQRYYFKKMRQTYEDDIELVEAPLLEFESFLKEELSRYGEETLPEIRMMLTQRLSSVQTEQSLIMAIKKQLENLYSLEDKFVDFMVEWDKDRLGLDFEEVKSLLSDMRQIQMAEHLSESFRTKYNCGGAE